MPMAYFPKDLTDHPGISADCKLDFLPLNRVAQLIPDINDRTIQDVMIHLGSEEKFEIAAHSYDFRVLLPEFKPDRPKFMLNLTPRIYKECRTIPPYTDLRDYDLYLPSRVDLGASQLGHSTRDSQKKRLLSQRPL